MKISKRWYIGLAILSVLIMAGFAIGASQNTGVVGTPTITMSAQNLVQGQEMSVKIDSDFVGDSDFYPGRTEWDECYYLYAYDENRVNSRVSLGSLGVGENPLPMTGDFIVSIPGDQNFRAGIKCYGYDRMINGHPDSWFSGYSYAGYSVERIIPCESNNPYVIIDGAYREDNGISVDITTYNGECSRIFVEHTITVDKTVVGDKERVKNIEYYPLAPKSTRQSNYFIDNVEPGLHRLSVCLNGMSQDYCVSQTISI